jgi:AhpD family alkylhydroperoxidase
MQRRLDRKTKHLIALGASLSADVTQTRYCLAVARQLGATDEELQETMAIAMTVKRRRSGLQESCLTSSGEGIPGRKGDTDRSASQGASL